MKKISVMFAVAVFMSWAVTAFAAEGPMELPKGANASAQMHNQEGIKHWNQGHADEALKHFEEASAADPALGEAHFNEALALDKLGKHGEATMHFKAAKKNANGNEAIINSAILNSHINH
ncbi:MAG: hypothetical protein COV67_08205 [Nitrospinae bacterium CG11_big_fil_rev_8_21_14_0_20_56_8]|nr:MAG: hypothetical protein COV67_08205 [Nitrospinae bacterium CG11_big_fil_rev_8_21_14_0_20_56_8]